MKKLKESAISKFKSGDYHEAFKLFSKILELDPFDIEAKLYLLLSDFAKENESDATLLFELYSSAKSQSIETIDDIFDSLLKESSIKSIKSELYDTIFQDDGNFIEYRDFKQLVFDRGSFKEAFEDMIFSVKIVIDNKDDFIDFITQLLENGYKNSALNYLESAALLYPHEEFFYKTIENIKA